MDQGIYCKNCGNYERLQFSPDGRYVKCPKCGAETPLYSEYKINEVSIDGFLSQDEKLRNGVKLLELQQYEQAWNVFQELTRERSADYRSWFGLARAATNDFTVDRVLPYDAHALDNAEYTVAGNSEGAQIVEEAKNYYQLASSIYDGKTEANKNEEEKKKEYDLTRSMEYTPHDWVSPKISWLIALAAVIPLYLLYKIISDSGFTFGDAFMASTFQGFIVGSLLKLVQYGAIIAAALCGIYGILNFFGFLRDVFKQRKEAHRRAEWSKRKGQQVDQKNKEWADARNRLAQAEQEMAQLLARRPQMLARWNQVMLNGKAVK